MQRYCRRRQQCCCRPSWASETLAFQLRARCLSVRHCRCELRHSLRTRPQMIMLFHNTARSAGQAASFTSTGCIIGVHMDQQGVGPDRQLQGSKPVAPSVRITCTSSAVPRLACSAYRMPCSASLYCGCCTGGSSSPACSCCVTIMARRSERFAEVAALNSVNALVAVYVVAPSHRGTSTEACVPSNANMEYPARSPPAVQFDTACMPANSGRMIAATFVIQL